MTVEVSAVISNTASGDGGGVYNWGKLTVQNGSTVGGFGAGNTAILGGGIYNMGSNGTTTVMGSRILLQRSGRATNRHRQ